MTDRIVVVSSACEYPDASNLNELYNNVIEQRRSFRLLPQDRLDWSDLQYREGPLKINSPYAGLLKNYNFDFQKYKIPYSTYLSTDLTHWLALDVTSRALNSIKLTADKFKLNGKTGVIIGNTLTGESSRANGLLVRWPFFKELLKEGLKTFTYIEQEPILNQIENLFKDRFIQPNEESLCGALANTIAGRIANYYDFKGGAFSVDGACASSLLAIEQSCARLKDKQWDMAICGGVDVSLDPFELVGFSRAGALTSKNMMLFDQDSSGFWPGEGCGIVVLMRESTAKKLEFPIQAVIAGCGISADGKGGMTRPTVGGQKSAISRALTQANCHFSDIDFVECHGTGTKIGDQIELTALSELASNNTKQCPVGSIKANIGHTKAAAGMAGFLKALICLQKEFIPPATGCINPIDILADENNKLEILDKPKLFENKIGRVGVSSFGFGGINAHVILERTLDYSGSETQNLTNTQKITQQNNLFIFSANNINGLLSDVKECMIANPSFAELKTLSAKLIKQNQSGCYRLCIIVTSPLDLFERLNKSIIFLQSSVVLNPSTKLHYFFEGCYFNKISKEPVKVGFIYPGQSVTVDLDSSWLFSFDRHLKQSITGVLKDIEGHDWTSTWASQLGVITSEVLTTKILKTAGIKPDVVLGHSVGEYAALWASGVITEQSLYSLVGKRGELMQNCVDGKTGMMTVKATLAQIQPIISIRSVQIACINSHNDYVLSGLTTDLKQLQKIFNKHNLPTLMLKVAGAFHSDFMKPASVSFLKYVDRFKFSNPTLKMISSVTGNLILNNEQINNLLVQQLVNPVEFNKAVANMRDSVDLIIEVGPGVGLSRLLIDTGVDICSTDSSQQNIIPLYQVMATSFCLGVDVNFECICDSEDDLETSSLPPHFISNVCGVSGSDMRIKNMANPSKVKNTQTTISDTDNPQDYMQPIEILKKIISNSTGLSFESICSKDRMLADLHLNSITTADITNRFVNELGKELNVMPTSFSESSLGDIVDSVLDMPDKDNDALILKSMDDKGWVGIYNDERILKLLSLDEQKTNKYQWQLISSERKVLKFTFLNEQSDALPKALLVYLSDKGMTKKLFTTIKDVIRQNEYQNIVILDSSGVSEGFFKSIFKERQSSCCLFLSGEISSIKETEILNLLENNDSWLTLFFENGLYYQTNFKRLFLETSFQVAAIHFETVIFTGGTKGIGLECACALLESSSINTLCVVGSSLMEEPDTELGLVRLRKYNINIRYYQCDLSQVDEVKKLVNEINVCFPQVEAIIHAAGINKPSSLNTLNYSDVESCVSVKATSLDILLNEITNISSLKLLIGFGSVIARYGLQGESHYALANEKMCRVIDKFGHLNSLCNAVCLDWSLWKEVGMASSLGVIDHFQTEGISPISVRQGKKVFQQIIRQKKGSKRYFVSGRWGEHKTLPPIVFEAKMLRFQESAPIYYPDAEIVLDNKVSELSDVYLQDHKIAEQAVFPAVMIMELCAQATLGLGVSYPYVFESFKLESAVLVNEGSEILIRAHAIRQAADSCQVSIYNSITNFKVTHASAQVSHLNDTHIEDVAPVDLTPCSLTFDMQKLYHGLYFNSGRFQRIEEIYTLQASFVTAKIQVRPEQWFANYKVTGQLLGDPGARDACLHVVQACYPTHRLLPVSVKKITLANSWNMNDCVFVTATELKSCEKNVLFDIFISDGKGRILEVWHEIQFNVIGEIDLPSDIEWSLISPDITRSVRNKLSNQTVNMIVTQGNDKDQRKTRAYSILSVDENIRKLIEKSPNIAAQHGFCISHSENFTLLFTANRCIGCDMEYLSKEFDIDELFNVLPINIKEFSSALSLHNCWSENERALAAWVVYEAMMKADLLHYTCALKIESVSDDEVYFYGDVLEGMVFFRKMTNAAKFAFSVVIGTNE